MGVVEVEVGRLVQRQNDSFAHSIDVALIADHDVLDSVELVVVSGVSTGQQRGSAATDGDGSQRAGGDQDAPGVDLVPGVVLVLAGVVDLVAVRHGTEP